jgi:hypothetical protein
MRARRKTQLSAEFPLNVVCDWPGNNAPITDPPGAESARKGWQAQMSGALTCQRMCLDGSSAVKNIAQSLLILMRSSPSHLQLAASVREALLQQASQSLTRGP